MSRKSMAGLLAALLLVFAVVACGGDDATEPPEGTPAASPVASAEA